MRRTIRSALSCAVAAGTVAVVALSASAQQDLTEMSKNVNQWVMTGRTYDLQRFSPLKQITTTNVQHLHPVWSMSTGTLRGHEGNPLVIGNVMYLQSSFPNKVYALDLTKEGAPQLWQFTPEQSADVIPIACCDVVNRGLAYSPKYNRLYLELLQGDLLALDAKTGKQVFRVNSANYKIGETMTNAPLVVGDAVITGISGGEFGVRGRVTAFSAQDGHELWRGYSTGPDKDVMITANTLKSPYPSDNGKDLGVSTWQGDEWQRGGGTTWGWYSYDPELNLFYYGSGNPGVWNPDQRPGDNKWSMSLWARNPQTGEVKWVYQMTPHDAWDYEGVDVKYAAGTPYVGAIVRMFPGPGGNRGAFIAWDPMTGKKVWSIKENLAAYGGAMATAGGVVFYGTMEGWLKAVDAKTGKVLWKYKTPSGIIGNPMTYTINGKQYVAVMSGIGGWAGIGVAAGIGAEDPTAGLGALGAFGDAGAYTNQGGVLTVFALDNAGTQ